ncbi:polysaccharide biosynthesis protein [Paenibacillus sp. 481]|uniref:polysaccharide biosynthesis protein n=1 Tax=Paenibacillus sp. 481 TaxID=2835869 RepID=UPI001E3457FA|nr:nucleoside-diphosphate sugar epimerase/dehydratase [Paenibacillus sp. 481]UHA71961.1 polysaccharide biosynthesis protein [Paenibacillus sp. 481]
MSKTKRLMLLLGLDFALAGFSVYWAFVSFYGIDFYRSHLVEYVSFAFITMCLSVCCLYRFKLYNRVWEYASVSELISILKAVFVSAALSYSLSLLVMEQAVSLLIALTTLETLILTIGGTRFIWRMVRSRIAHNMPQAQPCYRALIVGAGRCGSMVAKELLQCRSKNTTPVCFVDDDIRKHRLEVHGIPVEGGRALIPYLVEKYGITDIVIAMPSAAKAETNHIVEISKRTKARLRIIPILNDLIQGKVKLQHVQDINVEDLLGREPVSVQLDQIATYVTGKTVLVTGAGGSIGAELCRQIALFKPSRLLLLGHGENSIHSIEVELRQKYDQLAIDSLIADVKDKERMDELFAHYAPQVVFHAAAHKHVPLMERNPAEAVKNNVLGTKCVAECAHQYGAERFVYVSSDKAVNPTSVMGATKRVAEMIVQGLSTRSSTMFVAVRFGNVLGTRGSVIPHFQQQIMQGGPVTVTHQEMTRYFMTIPEAVQLVIQAGSLAKGGELFVLDMGKPVKIVDLATNLIRLSGFEPNVDIPIVFSGLRPGEKLYEELLTEEEELSSTTHDRIFIGNPMLMPSLMLETGLMNLERSLTDDAETVREALQKLVPAYSWLKPITVAPAAHAIAFNPHRSSSDWPEKKWSLV